jgi:hypothetical protein
VDLFSLYFVYTCQSRGFMGYEAYEFVQFLLGTPDPDQNSFTVIQHLSGQTTFFGETPNCGTEPHPLNQASNTNAFSLKSAHYGKCHDLFVPGEW